MFQSRILVWLFFLVLCVYSFQDISRGPLEIMPQLTFFINLVFSDRLHKLPAFRNPPRATENLEQVAS